MSDPEIDAEFFPIFEGATALVARQLAFFREEDAEPTENEKLMAGHIVGNLVANGYTQLPGTVGRLRAALEKIAGVREFDQADFGACARYKPDKGLWTLEEYVAAAALGHSDDRKETATPAADA